MVTAMIVTAVMDTSVIVTAMIVTTMKMMIVSAMSVTTVIATWSFGFWRKSRMKAWFLHLKVVVFEGSLARKLRFHIFNFQFLREVSHESFVFTSWSLQFNCDKVAAMSLCSFKRFLVPFIFHLEFLLKSFKNRTFLWLWRRDPVLEQGLARRSFCLANVMMAPKVGAKQKKKAKAKAKAKARAKGCLQEEAPKGSSLKNPRSKEA